MYAMQYQIALPTDYDMRTIRERVRTTGHLMDGYPGLEFKAYAIQERVNGAPHSAYAPFYVWRDTDHMSSFCWGDPGYSSIVRDFGRHPIQDWTLHDLVHGTADYASARSLSVQMIALPIDAPPSHCVGPMSAEFLASPDNDTIARVAAVDLATWTLILVELSVKAADQTTMDRSVYEVLHVSAAS